MSDGSITAPSSASQPVGDGFPQLLERVRVGDEQEARSVVERLYDQVRRIVLAHLPRREDPEDLMQEIFLKVFSRLGQYRGDVPFENWVARVALFTCLDGLRRQQCRPELRWADLSIEESRLLENLAQAVSRWAFVAWTVFHVLIAIPATRVAWVLRNGGV